MEAISFISYGVGWVNTSLKYIYIKEEVVMTSLTGWKLRTGLWLYKYTTETEMGLLFQLSGGGASSVNCM